jgi:hypothetical protein
MPQVQHDIPVYWANGREGQATRTGNNAAWICLCGRDQPLLGYSDRDDSVSAASVVACPDCGRQFRVVSDAARRAPSHVRELDPGAGTA